MFTILFHILLSVIQIHFKMHNHDNLIYIWRCEQVKTDCVINTGGRRWRTNKGKTVSNINHFWETLFLSSQINLSRRCWKWRICLTCPAPGQLHTDVKVHSEEFQKNPEISQACNYTKGRAMHHLIEPALSSTCRTQSSTQILHAPPM